jgi:maleylacetate reductase
MREFVHEATHARVVSGPGSLARIPAEVAALDLHRVLIIAGGSASAAAEQVRRLLGRRSCGRFGQVAQHVPERLVAAAVAQAGDAGVDGLCCVGGGSATGLAKALGVTLDVPIVAVPTTYAGSEATSVFGVTGQRKRTVTDPRARPRVVIYDPTLTTGLPARVTAASAFNALAHAVTALAHPTYEPVARLYAGEAVRLITGALPVAVRSPDDLAARGDLQWAAWLAGSALAVTGTGLHHRLCHVLGGSFGLTHADVHAVLLPHTVIHDESLDLADADRVLGGDAGAALRDLARRSGTPRDLAATGLPAGALDPAAAEAAGTIGTHDQAWFRALLDRAYHYHTERTPS